MHVHVFSFGRILKHSPDIAEIVFNEGVELSGEIFNEYHLWLMVNMSNPCKLLVNQLPPKKINIEARLKIGSLSNFVETNISHKAIFREGAKGDPVTKLLMKTQRDIGIVVEAFDNHNEALEWLKIV